MKRKTVRCIIQRNDTFLLAVHNNKRPENIGKWGIVGGHYDEDDKDLLTTVHREMAEEFGVQVTKAQHLADYETKRSLASLYYIEVAGELDNYDTSEILQIAWFTLPQIKKMQEENKLHTGYEYAAIRRYIHSDFADL